MKQFEDQDVSPLHAVRQRRVSLLAATNAFEAALASPSTRRFPEWSVETRRAADALLGCMRHHVEATEGPAGFHQEMLSAAPRLWHAVEVSVAEHVSIVSQLEQFLGLGEPRSADEVDSARALGTDIIAHISRHRQRGADMIFEAYESDLGGED